MSDLPLILVTNDDGITAPGIAALISVASKYGKVLVVAPDSPQSAKGHAITISSPLRLKKTNIYEGIEAYECNGTPVDCVKLAKNVILKEGMIDLCVSGINHGSNASINIIYSGTMSAAMEASLEGINSIGFSLENFSHDADMNLAMLVAGQIIEKSLKYGFPGKAKLLNVNIPDVAVSEFKGIKICRQADANWRENYQKGIDPRGQEYYWLTGEFINYDEGIDTDIYALQHDYVSVVPSMHDLTDHVNLDGFRFLEN